jgi:hypothetical protein
MKFTDGESYDFKEAYENENDDLMVKCPWCPNEPGCHPAICANMVGYGDDEINYWDDPFDIISEVSEVFTCLNELEMDESDPDKYDGVLKGIPYWEDCDLFELCSDASFHDFFENSPHIKTHWVRWDGMMISGNFGYAFCDQQNADACIKDLKEVKRRLTKIIGEINTELLKREDDSRKEQK